MTEERALVAIVYHYAKGEVTRAAIREALQAEWVITPEPRKMPPPLDDFELAEWLLQEIHDETLSPAEVVQLCTLEENESMPIGGGAQPLFMLRRQDPDRCTQCNGLLGLEANDGLCKECSEEAD